MALTYSFEAIKDYKTTVWIKTDEKNEDGTDKVRMNPVTEALIWGTMTIGIGRFTEDNIAEVVARFRIVERLHGAMVTKGGEPYHITDEEFVAHIGLACNVANETRAQWSRRMFVTKRTSITDDYVRSFEAGRVKAAA